MRTAQEIESAFDERGALDGVTTFVLVGIGGAGMSGVARMLRNRGYEVKGTDASASDEIARLIAEGFTVHIGHSGDLIVAGDALVLTDAIDLNTSPEVAKARELGCRVFRRSQVLGWLLKDKRVIAVTGTHGKTTTTSMIGAALRAAGTDPTIVVGAYVPEFGASILEGGGDFAVVEACEAYDSLRDFDPYIVVLPNLEPDHLDFHKDWNGLKGSVSRFVRRLDPSGKLIYCENDAGASEIAELVEPKVGYGVADELLEGMALPGEHNRLNARAAQLVGAELGLDATVIDQALRNFRGADRRFQVHFDGEYTVIDDYAHHPEEIRATLQALRERYPRRRIVVFFQPHLYSRTADFLVEFSKELSACDHLVITDIYPAREAPMPGISSSRIAEMVTVPVDYVPSRHLLPRFAASMVQPGDVIVGMGAGTISEFVPEFLREVKRDPKRVVVVYGGDSAEREVSLHSGRAIAEALNRQGFSADLMDVSEILLSGGSVSVFAGPNRPEVAFLAVHGNRAEDGAVQGFFELLHIPYTGSDIQTSAVAMDKELCKQLLSLAHLPFPAGVLICKGEALDRKPLPACPVVVKPNAQGSTVGLSFVRESADLIPAIERARHYGDDILVEEWVEGVEISVPVLCGEVLPAVEIVPISGSYDFASKYTPGATEEICPARISDRDAELAREYAQRCQDLLGCRGAIRVDMIVTERGPVILEINTLPGMTPTSLLPKSAETAGINFDELCVRILNDAL